MEVAVRVVEHHAVGGDLVHMRLIGVYKVQLRTAEAQIAREHASGRTGTYHGYFHLASPPIFIYSKKIHTVYNAAAP